MRRRVGDGTAATLRRLAGTHQARGMTLGGTVTETAEAGPEAEPGHGGRRPGAGRKAEGVEPSGPRQYLAVLGRVADVSADLHSAESTEVFTVPPPVEAAFERLTHGGMFTEATVMAVLLELADRTQRNTTEAVACAMVGAGTPAPALRQGKYGGARAFGPAPVPRPSHVNDA